MNRKFATTLVKERKKFNLWDLLAISLIFWVFILIKDASHHMYAPVPIDLDQPLSLDLTNLPGYALQTIVRLIIGIVASIVFSVVYALIAVKNLVLRKFMISLLDIMQSIPVLGYISFTITGFIALFPGNILGFELAVIFAVFTCQVWNITYSIYQSMISIPDDIQEVHKVFKLTSIQRFLLIELPYSIPSLVWNIMISISNSWFFVVASEALIEGNHSYYLPGIGSYIATAINEKSLISIMYAIGTMTIVIVLYDQFIFRPLIEWSNKFKCESHNSNYTPSWSYKVFNQSRLIALFNQPFKAAYCYLANIHLFVNQPTNQYEKINAKKVKVYNTIKSTVWSTILVAISLYAFYIIIQSLDKDIDIEEVKHSLYLGFVTTIRIIVVMLITVAIWLPVSIYIGLHPILNKIVQPLALTMASFPSNLIFPLIVFVIQKYSLNPDIWVGVLFVISIQWYLIFNILSGVCSIPENLREVMRNFDINGLQLFKKILLPAILPHFLIGAITAWGNAWNTTIVAEIAEWGDVTLVATGIGAYVTSASNHGNMSKIILGILVMLFYIELFNRFFWRPLFKYTDNVSRLK